MASTNKTTNYELSQFLGSDKPAWLSDYNTDMNKIDTQMKANADAASAADGKADASNTAIGLLTNLETTDKTNVVSAINEVNGTANTAQGTASQAAGIATTAKSEADALSSYLAITKTGQISNITVTGGTIGNINDMRYALNEDGTLGKIYGRLRIVPNTTGTVTVTMSIPSMNPSDSFTVNGGMWYNSSSSQYGITELGGRDFSIDATNHTLTFSFSGQIIGSSYTTWFPPCLYFFTDFGDVYNPDV